MNKLIIILLMALLSSCASFTGSQNLENGCAIDAVNLKIFIEKDSSVEWCRIIAIRYEYFGQEYGHAMCIFKLKDGTLWASDRSGQCRLFGNGINPYEVAVQLFKHVVSANYN